MDAKQFNCIQLMVLYPEKTQKEIAKEVGVSEQTIVAWKKQQTFQEALKSELDDCWKELAYKAQKRMNDLLDSPNDSVALGASKYVLDSYGRGAVQKVDLNVDRIIGIEDDNS